MCCSLQRIKDLTLMCVAHQPHIQTALQPKLACWQADLV